MTAFRLGVPTVGPMTNQDRPIQLAGNTSRAQPAKARRLRARRIGFDYPQGGLDRHYVDNDLVMSHVTSMLSAMFPEGEDFFVRSVRYYNDDITDPELKSQVAGFVGQEITHGREHRNINERLEEMGFPTRYVDRSTRRQLAVVEYVLPHSISLAVTAALEHYTATLAGFLLTSPEARALITSDEVRAMLLWHAYEEVEHKAVAFDVYRHTGGSEFLRIATMRVVTVTSVLGLIWTTALSLLRDRAAYSPRALFRSIAQLRHGPWASRQVLDDLRKYNKRGFHPDDIDTTELLERWRTELFGDKGALVDHLK